jgi:outer membrane protein OmpA-like peptidoglycan-associated protein
MKAHLLSRIPFMLGVLAAAAGCSTTLPPQDLSNARAAYARASRGPTAQVAPADLQSAKESLDVAEQSFEKNGNSQETRDTAYAATRRAELAESHARAILATQAKEQSNTKLQLAATSTAQKTAAELGRAKIQIAMQGQTLENERQRREDAEKRSAQAAADLARFATVKQEPRGLVITLSGSVLFASAKSDLLPAAQLKLNEVAEVLTKQDPDSNITVEGHTDSQGGATYNQELSQRRAATVRDYLVSRGMAKDRVTAEGFGFTRSIADNASTEGRANNRRVEIVVKAKE